MRLADRLAKLEGRHGAVAIDALAEERAAEREAAAKRVWAKLTRLRDSFAEADADLTDADLCKRSPVAHFAWRLRFGSPTRSTFNEVRAMHGLAVL